jgi:hypothetical protein
LREERKQLIIQLFKVAMLHGIRVRILTSKDVQKLIEELTERQQKIVKTIARKEKNEKGKEEEDIGGSVAASVHTQGKFEIHLIDKLQQQKQTNVSILIVDSKVCLVEDLKAHEENNNNNSDETLPLATYSNRESTVLTYISIFETLWTQTQLRIHRVSDKLKQH